MSITQQINWNSQGLVPAIAQDWQTGEVLMLAWMNREALELTVQESRAVYWSRSRQAIWRKGEESGHVQSLKELRIDCDADTVLMKVDQVGGIACHTGRRSCFYQKLGDNGWQVTEQVVRDPQGDLSEGPMNDVLQQLARTLEARKQSDPEQSYVASLHEKGLNKILEKVGEEATEVILAAKDCQVNGEQQALVGEVADLWFHSMVMLSHLDININEVTVCLQQRFGISGHDEKAARGDSN